MKNILLLPFRYTPQFCLFYLATWVVWFCVLWFLSSRPPDFNQDIDVPHLDKVLHFGYFACGAIVSASALYHFKKKSLGAVKIIFACLILGAFVGALDEYHQSWIAGRHGNDPADWLADCLGSLAGAYYAVWGWGKYLSLKTLEGDSTTH